MVLEVGQEAAEILPIRPLGVCMEFKASYIQRRTDKSSPLSYRVAGIRKRGLHSAHSAAGPRDDSTTVVPDRSDVHRRGGREMPAPNNIENREDPGFSQSFPLAGRTIYLLRACAAEYDGA
jgi:hypothetical protein